jgi:hypothetical protein
MRFWQSWTPPTGACCLRLCLGGSEIDAAYSVAVDSAGNPIVSGVTGSEDFVTTSSQAIQRRRRGTVDAFVTKVDRDGRSALWSTYCGGSKENSDQYAGGSIVVDEAGRVWLDSTTNSPGLPTRNPCQASYGGGDFDGFIAAFPSSGARLCYGSYAGRDGHDILEGSAAGKGKARIRSFVIGQHPAESLEAAAWVRRRTVRCHSARIRRAGGPQLPSIRPAARP